MMLKIYQVPAETLKRLRQADPPEIPIDDEMAGHFPVSYYQEVFDGEIPAGWTEETIFVQFNRAYGNHMIEALDEQVRQGLRLVPDGWDMAHGYPMRSLSVGDVIEFNGKVLRVERFGFEDITEAWRSR